MDNDNKINDENNENQIVEYEFVENKIPEVSEVGKEVQLFLSDCIGKTLEKPEMYNLENEYAKTKKNKSRRNLITFLITLVVVAAASFAITKYIDYKNEQIDVGIDVFDDINLMNLLNMVGQVKSDISAAMDEKANLELEMEDELHQLDLRHDAEKNLILKKRIEYDEKKQQLLVAERSYLREKDNITKDYEKRIAVVDKKIEGYEEQLQKYESANLQMAEAQKSALDSERQLYELEMDKQRKEYEATIAALRQKLQEQQRQAVLDQRRAVEIAVDEYRQRINQLDPVIEDEKVKKIMQSLHPEFEIIKPEEDEHAYAERILAEVSEAAKNENEGYVYGLEVLPQNMLENAEGVLLEGETQSDVLSHADEINANAAKLNGEGEEKAEKTEIASENTDEKEVSQNNFMHIIKTAFTAKKKQTGENLFGDDSAVVNKTMDEMKSITDYVDAIPYENGLSKYVVVMDELANSATHELKVQATEKINQQNKTISSLAKYFDAIYLDEKGNGKDELAVKDGVVVSKTDSALVCYVVPKKRAKAEKSKAVFTLSEENTKTMSLKKSGDFIIAIPSNSDDLNAISNGMYFVFQ